MSSRVDSIARDMAAVAKRRRVIFWECGNVTSCKCSALSYCHTHCPCEDCNGRAVSRATEYRHWKKASEAFLDLSVNHDIEQSDTIYGDGNGDTEEHSTNEVDIDETDVVECGSTPSPEHSPSPVSGVADDPQSSNTDCDNLQMSNPECEQVLNTGAGVDGKQEVIKAVLNAVSLNEEVNGSQHHFMSILDYGKNLYCNGANDSSLKEYWPSSWQSSIQLLKDNGYKDPKEFFICLGDDHPCSYDIMDSSTKQCHYCDASQATYIKYSYLPLKDKIERWCSVPAFCRKMTAHWVEREHWLESMTTDEDKHKKEVRDGARFNELSWFWDPSCEWVLPARCPSCKLYVGAEVLKEASSHDSTAYVTIECPECHFEFNHHIKTTLGDPRNIALIGHWDGWQPFCSSIKHSSGMVGIIL